MPKILTSFDVMTTGWIPEKFFLTKKNGKNIQKKEIFEMHKYDAFLLHIKTHAACKISVADLRVLEPGDASAQALPCSRLLVALKLWPCQRNLCREVSRHQPRFLAAAPGHIKTVAQLIFKAPKGFSSNVLQFISFP